MVFPGKVERGREGLVDVAGGAESLADDDPVGLAGPVVGFASGEPIAGGGHESFAERNTIGDRLEEAGEAVGGAEDIGVSVREGDVILDGLAMVTGREGGEE